MSVGSLLVRLLVVLCVVCLVSGQSSSTASSSSSSSSSSTGTYSISSSSVTDNSTGASTGVISSSSSIAPTVAPVIISISGCNSSWVGNSSSVELSSCDGSTGASVITIVGAFFNGTMTVQIGCPSQTYQSSVVSSTPTLITSYTPGIDKADVDQSCQLYVTNAFGQKSNSKSLTFGSWSTDVEGAWRLLGLSFMSFIIAVTVIGIVILVAVILCSLACCCGVSLAFLNCCCRTRGTTVVLSPQSSGYASMA